MDLEHFRTWCPVCPCEDKFCGDKTRAQRSTSALCSLVLTYVLSLVSDVFTVIFDFLIRTKKSVIPIFILDFSGPCASLTHLVIQLILTKVGQRSEGFDLPAGISETSPIANKYRIQEAGVSPGHLPSHCCQPSGNICSLFKSIWQGSLPKLLGDLIPNSSELDFDPNPLSSHWILSFILTTLQTGILINCVAPSQTCTLIDTPSKTLEHQLPYPMPESDLLRD